MALPKVLLPSNQEPIDIDMVETEYKTESESESSTTSGGVELIKCFCCHVEGCNAQFRRRDRLNNHMKFHKNGGKKPFQCTHCDKRYMSPAAVRRHTKMSHEPQGYKRIYRCTYENCIDIFKTSDTLKKHLRFVHEGRKYKCSNCSKTFKKHQQLKIHEYEHTGIKPFSCTFQGCEQSFTLPSRLKSHQKTHEAYKCKKDGCDKHFPKWSLLVGHMKSDHKPEFKCKDCDKSFNKRCNLREHASVHGKSRNVLPCPYEGCKRFYFFSRNLKQHIKAFHEQKLFKCSFTGCDKEFKHKVTLKKHEKIHNTVAAVVTEKKKRKCRKRRSNAAFISGYKPTLDEDLPLLVPGIVEKKVRMAESLAEMPKMVVKGCQ